MPDDLDRAGWERRWEQAISRHGAAIGQAPPKAHLVEVAASLAPGRALDAGCGHGAESLHLARAGWTVTGVDFSAQALALAAATAAAAGVGDRITWTEADLSTWAPPAAEFDLVACLYVHVPGEVTELVARLATGVTPGGHLLLVGHRPIDPATGRETPAAGQVQVSVEEALAALPRDAWEVLVAEERPRARAGEGVDAVIHALRRE